MRSEKKAKEDEAKIKVEQEQEKEKKSSVLREYIETQEKYKEAKSKLPKKGNFVIFMKLDSFFFFFKSDYCVLRSTEGRFYSTAVAKVPKEAAQRQGTSRGDRRN